jgi:HPt (histidine-containing phosphotransfer) domain-containing protein
LDQFEDEMSRRIPAMREAAARGDASTLEHLASLLQSRARALGADRCVEACDELETVGRQGTLGEAPVFLAQLEDELDRLRVTAGLFHQAAEHPG